MPRIIIANSLADGFVVFLTATNSWSRNIADAAVANSAAQADNMLETAKAAEQSNKVLDPYLIEVQLDGPAPRPIEYREFIRAYGPTVAIPADG